MFVRMQQNIYFNICIHIHAQKVKPKSVNTGTEFGHLLHLFSYLAPHSLYCKCILLDVTLLFSCAVGIICFTNTETEK